MSPAHSADVCSLPLWRREPCLPFLSPRQVTDIKCQHHLDTIVEYLGSGYKVKKPGAEEPSNLIGEDRGLEEPRTSVLF
jgi:hypothetical protein